MKRMIKIAARTFNRLRIICMMRSRQMRQEYEQYVRPVVHMLNLLKAAIDSPWADVVANATPGTFDNQALDILRSAFQRFTLAQSPPSVEDVVQLLAKRRERGDLPRLLRSIALNALSCALHHFTDDEILPAVELAHTELKHMDDGKAK